MHMAAWHLTELALGNLQVDNQTSIGAPVLIGPDTSSARHQSSSSMAAQRTPPHFAAPRADTVLSFLESMPSSSARARAARVEEQQDSAHASATLNASAAHTLGDYLCVKVSKLTDNSKLNCFDTVEVALADTFVDVDETVLVRLVAAFTGILTALSLPDLKEDDVEDMGRMLQLNAGALGALDLSLTGPDRSRSDQKWTYIESLRIQTIRLYLTIHSSDDAHGLLESLGPLSKLPMFALVEAFKAMVSNVDRAPIVLHNISWDRPFLPQKELVSRMTKHYTSNLLYGFYRLVGSLEVLGNPMGLVSNISQGVTGLMDHTGSGFRDMRQGHFGAMGKDLALGAASLAAGTVQGVFGSASSLSHAMVKGMAQLTFDGDYKRARALMDHDRPSHLAQGILQGSKRLGRGLFEGVTGVVGQPVKGLRKGGGTGALKGLAKGMVGLVVKPAAGLVDMVAYTSEGMRNTPGYLSKRALVLRVRLPRVWPPGAPVSAFDARAAIGAELFARLCAQQGWKAIEMQRLPYTSRSAQDAERRLNIREEGERVCHHAAWLDSALGPAVMFVTTHRLIVCAQKKRQAGQALPELRLKVAVRLDKVCQLHVHGASLHILALGGSESVCSEVPWLACWGRRPPAYRRALVAAGAGAGKKHLVVELNVPEPRLRRWMVQTIQVACASAGPLHGSQAPGSHPPSQRPTCQLLEGGDNQADAHAGTRALTRMTLVVQRVSRFFLLSFPAVCVRCVRWLCHGGCVRGVVWCQLPVAARRCGLSAAFSHPTPPLLGRL